MPNVTPAQNRCRIAVIGTGQIGSSAALAFAIDGYPVTLISRSEAGTQLAVTRIREFLRILREHNVIAEAAAHAILGGIATATTLEAAADASFVLEAIPESVSLKQALYDRLESLIADESIIASATSGLPISDLAAKARRPERIIGAHFWNPPHLMRLVEVVCSERTAREVVLRTCDLIRSLDRYPVIAPDIPGQLGNRLQYAMIREAISLINRGVATAAEIDAVVKMGFGSRIGAIGPLELSDLIGLDLVQAIEEYLQPDTIRYQQQTSDILLEKVGRGELGMATGKGFYDWNPESSDQLRQRVMDELIHRYRTWRTELIAANDSEAK